MKDIKMLISEDCFVCSSSPNKNFSKDDKLLVGQHIHGQSGRILFKFPIEYEDIVKNNQIDKIKLCLHVNSKETKFNKIKLYNNVERFSVNDVTWKSRPKVMNCNIQFSDLKTDDDGYVELDITNMYNNLFCIDRGITIDLDGYYNRILFASSRSNDPPYLKIFINN